LSVGVMVSDKWRICRFPAGTGSIWISSDLPDDSRWFRF
jgi:hypothetical protein